MKIKGCFLTFGEKVKGYTIGLNCEIIIPKIIPIVYRPRDLGHQRIIGACNVMKTNNKLFLKNAYIFEDKLSECITKDTLDIGGGLGCKYYAMSSHDGILDKAKLVEVHIVHDPINDEYKYEIVDK